MNNQLKWSSVHFTGLCVLQPRDPIVTETFKKNRILVFCLQFILYAQKDFANVVGHF